MHATTPAKSARWRAPSVVAGTALDRRRTSRSGRTSGLIAARAKALGLAPPDDPHTPGDAAPPPRRKPGRIVALLFGRNVVGATSERVRSEKAALFGDQAARLAAFEPPPAAEN